MKTAFIAIATGLMGFALGAWLVLAQIPDGFPEGMSAIPLHDKTGVVQGMTDALAAHCKRRGQPRVLMVMALRDGKPSALSADCQP